MACCRKVRDSDPSWHHFSEVTGGEGDGYGHKINDEKEAKE